MQMEWRIPMHMQSLVRLAYHDLPVAFHFLKCWCRPPLLCLEEIRLLDQLLWLSHKLLHLAVDWGQGVKKLQGEEEEVQDKEKEEQKEEEDEVPKVNKGHVREE